MYLFNVCSLLFMASWSPTSRALPASCQTDWKINWQVPHFSKFEPFTNPGEILPGMTVNDILWFIGMFWNTSSWEEFMGHVCIHFGPPLDALYPKMEIQSECDNIVTSLQKGRKLDTLGICVSYWNQIGVEKMTWDWIEEKSPHSHSSMFNLDPRVTVYAINPLQKISRVAFKILDWLGPSPFFGDWFGACSALRILLNEKKDYILDQLKNFLTYLVADTLEYIHNIDVCKGNTTKAVQIILDLFTLLQERDVGICEFLTNGRSREDYLEKGEKLVDIALRVVANVDTCIDALIVFLPYCEEYDDTCYNITGLDLTSDPGIQRLCGKLSYAFSENTPDITKPYPFPTGDILRLSSFQLTTPTSVSQDDNAYNDVMFSSDSLSKSYDYEEYKNWDPPSFNSPRENAESYRSTLQADDTSGNAHQLSQKGQLPPNSTFIRAIDILGAFVRSDTVQFDILSSGLVVLCNLMELSHSDFEPSVPNMCTALRSSDLASFEKMCSVHALHPVRTPFVHYIVVTGIEMTRKLFRLSELSRPHVCTAVNEYIHSNNSLQSMIRFGLDVYLAEILPVVNEICNDDKIILMYFKNKTNLTDEEIERRIQISINFFVKHLGYSNRNQLCQAIDAGVDNSTRRSNTALIETMQEQFLLFLTDTQRCKKSAEFIEMNFVEMNMKLKLSELLKKYTGFMSLNSFCENLNGFFDPDSCAGTTSSTGAGTIPDANVLLKALAVMVAYLMCMVYM